MPVSIHSSELDFLATSKVMPAHSVFSPLSRSSSRLDRHYTDCQWMSKDTVLFEYLTFLHLQVDDVEEDK
jgi:hypothetical protein